MAYDDAWTQFMEPDGYDKLSGNQIELIEKVRERMQELYPKRDE